MSFDNNGHRKKKYYNKTRGGKNKNSNKNGSDENKTEKKSPVRNTTNIQPSDQTPTCSKNLSPKKQLNVKETGKASNIREKPATEQTATCSKNSSPKKHFNDKTTDKSSNSTQKTAIEQIPACSKTLSPNQHLNGKNKVNNNEQQQNATSPSQRGVRDYNPNTPKNSSPSKSVQLTPHSARFYNPYSGVIPKSPNYIYQQPKPTPVSATEQAPTCSMNFSPKKHLNDKNQGINNKQQNIISSSQRGVTWESNQNTPKYFSPPQSVQPTPYSTRFYNPNYGAIPKSSNYIHHQPRSGPAPAPAPAPASTHKSKVTLPMYHPQMARFNHPPEQPTQLSLINRSLQNLQISGAHDNGTLSRRELLLSGQPLPISHLLTTQEGNAHHQPSRIENRPLPYSQVVAGGGRNNPTQPQAIGPSFSNQGPRFSNQGPRFSNQDPRFSNQGPRISNQGPRISNQGPRISNQGRRFSNEGPHFSNQGFQPRPMYPQQRPVMIPQHSMHMNNPPPYATYPPNLSMYQTMEQMNTPSPIATNIPRTYSEDQIKELEWDQMMTKRHLYDAIAESYRRPYIRENRSVSVDVSQLSISHNNPPLLRSNFNLPPLGEEFERGNDAIYQRVLVQEELERRETGGSERPVGMGANGIFTRRLDFSSFNKLSKKKHNSYDIKMEDEGNHGNDETRCFILSTLAGMNRPRVHCILCDEEMLVFDRYPLVDGTFFLSPRKHNQSCIEVQQDMRTVYLGAVCMSCLEAKDNPRAIYCIKCGIQWKGSSLVLGTCYSYDIFAAMPCCIDRLNCNNCFQPLLSYNQRLNYFSDYSRLTTCPHCKTPDYHFVKPLSYSYTRDQIQLYRQWP